MQKLYPFFIVCLLNLGWSFQSVFSQSISPSVIGTTGNYSLVGGMSISSSVGEPMVTTVGPVGGLILTQGFEQPLFALSLTAISATPNDTICFGNSTSLSVGIITGTPIYTYNWSPSAGLSCTNCSNPVASPTITTTYTVVVTDGLSTTDSKSITIAVWHSTSSITGQDSICKGNAASLTDNISGGLSPYAFSWNGGSFITQTIVDSPTTTTTYSVLTTDEFGCTATATHTVAVISNPTVTISGTTTICNGSSTTLTASGASSYVWSPNTNLSSTTIANPVANPTANITYSVTGTSLGCTGTNTVAITITQPPTAANAGPDQTLCSPMTSATLAGNNPAIGTGLWTLVSGTGTITTPAQNNTTVTGLVVGSPATFRWTISNGVCASSADDVVINVISPAAPFPVNSNSPVCSGGVLNLTSSGPIGSYQWNGPNGFLAFTQNTSINNVTAAAAGTYFVHVTVSGCSSPNSSVNIVVNATPTVSISPASATICNGVSIKLTASGANSYVWAAPATALTCTNCAAPNANPTITTTYTVTGTSTGCAGTKTITVTVNPTPTVTASGASTICNGQSSVLLATGNGGTSPYTYSWLPTGSTPSITVSPTANATYSVFINDIHGCTSNTSTVAVTVNPLPPTPAYANSNAPCSGDTLFLSSDPSLVGTYNWNGPNSFAAAGINTFIPNVTTAASGTYSVTVTNGGCAGPAATVSVTVNPTPAAPAASAAPGSLCEGQTLTLTASSVSGAVSYNWSGPNGFSDANQNPAPITTVTTAYSGTYSVTAKSAQGCNSLAGTVSVTVNALPAASVSASSTTICAGQTATLTASGGTSYSWNTTSTNNPLTVSPTGNTTYSVAVTSAAGCTGNTSIAIAVSPSPTVTISAATTICGGSSATLIATTSAGNSYAWSSGQTSSSIIVSPTANTGYNVTVSNGSCLASATTTVTGKPALAATLTLTNPTCNGSCDGTISAAVSGGYANYAYAWSPSGGNSSAATGLCATNYTVQITDAFGCTASAATAITDPLIITTSVSSASVTCNGASTGSATVATSGGTGPFTYSWNPSGGNAATATNLTAGNYSVLITDANGCTATNSVSISEPTPLFAGITSLTNVSCNGGNNGSVSILVNGGTPNYTYSWSPSGGTNASATGLSAGTYVFTVTDNNGCIKTTSAFFTSPSAITPTVTPTNVLCNGGNTGSATIAASGGTGVFTYAWSNGGSSSAISNLIATTYSVLITDGNGCTQTASVVVTEPNVLLLSPATTTTSCSSGSDGTADANPSGGTTPYTFTWDAAAGNQLTQIATGLAAGNYSVVIKDANSCTNSATVTVVPGPVLTPSISASALTICSGTNTTLTATGGTNYSWWNVVALTPSISVSPSSQTTYSVSITQVSCTRDTFITINVNPTPATAFTYTTVCLGQTTTFADQSAITSGTITGWNWNFGDGNTSAGQNPSNTYTASGNYSITLTATSNNGCNSTATQTITINSLPNIIISGNNTICSGHNTTLSASGGNTYSWLPSNQTTSSITTSILNANASYTVIGTSSANCSAPDTITVQVVPTPTVVTISANPNTTTICAGSSITLTAAGGQFYSWSNGATGAVVVLTPTATTNYSVTATNGASCSLTAPITITVNPINAVITTNDSTLCLGDFTQLTASGGISYSWSSGQTTAVINISPTATTTYSVYVTNTTGCSGTDNITVTVNTKPQPTISALSNTICLGQNTILTAGGGTNYSWWSSGQNTSAITVTPTSAGNITYSVSVGNGTCHADTFITINVNALPSVSASVMNPSNGIICPGDTATLGGTCAAPVTFVWNPGNILGATIDVSPATTTSYTVIVTDTTTQCSNSSSTTLTVSNIFATATSDKTTICPGFTAHLDVATSGSNSSVTYLWTGPLNDPAAQNPSATLDSTTTFTIEVSNQVGCKDKDTLTIFVSRDASCVIYIYNGITPNGDGDNDVWAIDGIQSFPDNKVQIFSRWGVKLWEGKGYNNKDIVWKGTNSKNENLPDGTYYYNVELYDTNGSVLYSASKWVEVTH